MPTSHNSFPIQGRSTDEFPTETQLSTLHQLITWSGVVGDNLRRIKVEDLANSLLAQLSTSPSAITGTQNLTLADTWVQSLNTNGVDATVTAANGSSFLIHNASTTGNINTPNGCLAPGEVGLVIWTGSAHVTIPMGGKGGSDYLDVTLTDLTDATHYYYGGVDNKGSWKINRYSHIANTKASATEANNSGTTDLNTAWANRTTLTY